MRKWLLVSCLLLALAGSGIAESRRTLFTFENKVPEKGQLEIGALGWYREVPDERPPVVLSRDEYTATPYLRYGLTENANLTAQFPYRYNDPKFGDSEQGPGDVELGAELVAFQDILNYPYILTHVAVCLPTGDEDKGLGEGETRPTFGVSVGTTIYDVLHFVIDASYTIYRDEENEAVFSGAIIWDVGKELSLSAEASVSDKEVESEGDKPIYYLGGMTYRVSEALQVSVYGGGSQNAETDALAGVKVSYSF